MSPNEVAVFNVHEVESIAPDDAAILKLVVEYVRTRIQRIGLEKEAVSWVQKKPPKADEKSVSKKRRRDKYKGS